MPPDGAASTFACRDEPHVTGSRRTVVVLVDGHPTIERVYPAPLLTGSVRPVALRVLVEVNDVTCPW